MSGKVTNVSTNLNYNGNESAYEPNLQVYKDELYCTWKEWNGPNYQIKIKKYNENSWTNVSDNLNYNGSNHASDLSLQVYKNELYYVWSEDDGSYAYKIKIKKYNGTNWINVSDNLNYNKNMGAYKANLQVYKDDLYCGWNEWNGSNYQIKMKKYNGSGWSNVSSNLNCNGNQSAYNLAMQIYKDELYCAWREKSLNNYNYQIRMKKYNGSSWTNVSNNLNYDESMEAQNQNLQVYKNELYCVWQEKNINSPDYQIKIKKYDGISWSNISDNLNYNVSQAAGSPNLQVYKDELYCAWTEYNDTGSNHQIKMKKYNGNTWVNISNNLNYYGNMGAINPNMQIYKGELYCVWVEKNINGSNYQIMIKKYNSVTQKFLIKQNDKYFKINDNGEISEVENNNFKTNGFDNINIITRELLENKFNNLKNIQILMWTNDREKIEANMTFELRNPYRPIDILKKNNNGICNILFKEL